MKKLILFFSISLFFVGCNPQGGGGTQPEPYKRPFPTKVYYNGTLKKSIVLDSNSRVIEFTNYYTNIANQEYIVKYDNQGRIDSVYRLFNGRKLGTYWSYPAIDSIYMRRFDDTTWDYDYGLKYSPTHLEYISTATSRDYEFDLSGDTITKSEWITNQNPYVLYKQEANVLGDSINPLWLEENPLFSWYYLWILDEVFSSKMPVSTNNIGNSGGAIYDNFYDAQGRLIERRAVNSSGSTFTMELSYN
jgi:hypothetical protein